MRAMTGRVVAIAFTGLGFFPAAARIAMKDAARPNYGECIWCGANSEWPECECGECV